MADLNEIQLELLPLRKTGSSPQHYKEDDTICGGGGGPDRVGIDSDDMAYRSTLLPLQGAPHADAMGRRERVLPRVKKRLREESQRIRDKGRRWREQKTQQCRLNLKDCDAVAPLRSGGQGFREMSLRQELMHRQRNHNKARRIDSEFDILELCQMKGTTKSRNVLTAVESSGFDSSLRRNGNDVQTLIEKDGKKKSDMAVYFDKEDATYSTGDTIKGHVNITLTQDVRVRDLKLQIFGNGRVSWGEQRSYIKGSAPKVLLRNSEVFLDHSMTLMRMDGGLVVRMADGRRGSSHLPANETTAASAGTEESIYLPAGVHNYPFEFDLPHDLPGSFEGRWGQVRYGVKATLVRPWKFDIEREKDFTLRCLIDLNDEPELARPIGALGEFSPGLMCIRSGAVTVELRIGRRGYVPGESIQFYVEVENNSRRKLQDTSVSLVQHVTYRAGKKMRKTSANVASLRKGETLPYSTVVWNTESVLIPPTPGTSCKYYKGIQIKYAVSLLVKYSSWSDAFCLSVPIVLGTTGLRRQTINTYLSMLGYCQTPRGSPANGRRNSNGQVVPSAIRPATRQSLTAPCITGNVRHSSISSLQSVSKPRRNSPVCTTATRPRRDTALTLSSSKDNGLDASQVNGVGGSKSGARCRLSSQLKPKSKSLDSTDKEEEEEREEEGERARCGKKDEDDDVFTKTDDEVKRTGVK